MHAYSNECREGNVERPTVYAHIHPVEIDRARQAPQIIIIKGRERELKAYYIHVDTYIRDAQATGMVSK